MWSWCGQVSSASAADIDTYLNLMSQLEADYADVNFVYMTGHLDGSGPAGNLYTRNNQIRTYARSNGKVLFDFADIESLRSGGQLLSRRRRQLPVVRRLVQRAPGRLRQPARLVRALASLQLLPQRPGAVVAAGAAGGVGWSQSVTEILKCVTPHLRWVQVTSGGKA